MTSCVPLKTPTQHFDSITVVMAAETSSSEPPTEPTSRITVLRSRAFLSDLPDDFLNPTQRVTVSTDGHRPAGPYG